MNPSIEDLNNNNINELKQRVSQVNISSESENSSSDESSNNEDDEEDDDEIYEMSEVKGLFSNQMFKSVIEMFKHEADCNHFNLIEIVNKFKLDMISYIKLINFIRKEVFEFI